MRGRTDQDDFEKAPRRSQTTIVTGIFSGVPICCLRCADLLPLVCRFVSSDVPICFLRCADLFPRVCRLFPQVCRFVPSGVPICFLRCAEWFPQVCRFVPSGEPICSLKCADLFPRAGSRSSSASCNKLGRGVRKLVIGTCLC